MSKSTIKNYTHNIVIRGAKENNLKNIDVVIPHNKLTVITGISGSGKSSLAFNTIFNEGQRRYMESFSIYARQFIGKMEKPNVDEILGLSPVISIEQKTTNNNPRSTIGTVTEIYDFLRLLFTKISVAFSYNTGKKMVCLSNEEIANDIIKKFENKNINILGPIVIGRKGTFTEPLKKMVNLGFENFRLDGQDFNINSSKKINIDRYKNHNLDVYIDKLTLSSKNVNRFISSLNTALDLGNGMVYISTEKQADKIYSIHLSCPDTGISYPSPNPNSFSFNSPFGWCPECKGLGNIKKFSLKKIIPHPEISISAGAFAPAGPASEKSLFLKIKNWAKKAKINLNIPYNQLTLKEQNQLLFGTQEFKEIDLVIPSIQPESSALIAELQYFYNLELSNKFGNWIEQFIETSTCSTCLGGRLNIIANHFKINHLSITNLALMDLISLKKELHLINNNLSSKQKRIVGGVMKELFNRLNFLLNVGLEYMHLHRPIGSLSGGESQRIRLSSQIGSNLQGITYILDEPSIGLHQRDNQKLIQSLKSLSQQNNTVIVIEHDKDIMLAADYLIDIGPGAGLNGGHLIFQASPKKLDSCNSNTIDYLRNIKRIEIPAKRREGNKQFISIKNVSGNNLKNIDLKIPLGKLIVFTGVSGSGKSSLVIQTLVPAIKNKIYNSFESTLPFKDLQGVENIDKLIEIDQKPIGRTPRSNPATYCGFFQEIRELFAATTESKARDFKIGRFSFNVKGGRCEECGGSGLKIINLNFLPDVTLTCENCKGLRYNKETLFIKFKNKNITEVLNMNVDEAVEFFKFQPGLYKKLKVLQDVGLGYITLGQPSTTISGGEAQRIKLSAELNKRDTGKTLYILDEPSTGLHFQDIDLLMKLLQRLVNKGNTVIIIEHNLDIIKLADHIFDLGPEGGVNGGKILFSGTPEELIKQENNYTANYLKPYIDASN